MKHLTVFNLLNNMEIPSNILFWLSIISGIVMATWLLISVCYSCYMRFYASGIIRRYKLHCEIYPQGLPDMIRRLFITDICLYNKKINNRYILWVFPRLKIENLIDL